MHETTIHPAVLVDHEREGGWSDCIFCRSTPMGIEGGA